MLQKEFFNGKNLKAINEVNKRLNRLPCWTSMDNQSKYNRLNKHALNSIITCMLAIYAEHQGRLVIWERLPKIAIYKDFQKTYIFYDTRRKIIEAVLQLGGIPKSIIEQKSMEVITELTDENFCNFLCEGLDTFEMRLSNACNRIANLVELKELSLTNNPEVTAQKFSEILSSLEPFKDIPGVLEFSDMDGEYFNCLLNISKRRNIDRFNYMRLFFDFSILRNQNRWAVQMAPINCSVLGHEKDSSTWAYLIGLEAFESEKIATSMWKTMLFHDQSEAYTNDMPSPFKALIPGFREALELYEEQMLQAYLYDKMPDFMANAIRKIMIGSKENAHLYKYLKGADYLSADSECWRQYQMGSRDPYFLTSAMQDFEDSLKSGKYILPPMCRKLHDYFMNYARICLKPFEGLDDEF